MFSLGGQTFSSKVKAKDAIKAILHKPPRKVDSQESRILTDIFKMHPEKGHLLDNVDYFLVQKGPYGTNQFAVMLKNAEVVTFSYRLCFGDTGQKFVDRAFRSAIQPQIQQFKKDHKETTGDWKCTLCKKNFTSDQVEVDHIVQHKDLVAEFVCSKGIYASTFIWSDAICFFSDKSYEKLWSDYHKDTAQLQILCRSCHCKKSRSQ